MRASSQARPLPSTGLDARTQVQKLSEPWSMVSLRSVPVCQ